MYDQNSGYEYGEKEYEVWLQDQQGVKYVTDN